MSRVPSPRCYVLSGFFFAAGKSTLDAVPEGKAKLEMPLWVVTASDTEMGVGPSSTW